MRTPAENHTTVSVDGILLTIASQSDATKQCVAVLTKAQAEQIVNALTAAHKLETESFNAGVIVGEEKGMKQSVEIIKVEPELEGDMPDSMWKEFATRESATIACRAIVRTTKEACITKILSAAEKVGKG